jgi:hypothetical protein
MNPKLFILSLPLALSACGGGTPACDNSNVIGTLKEQMILTMKDATAGSATGGLLGALKSDGAYENLKKPSGPPLSADRAA